MSRRFPVFLLLALAVLAVSEAPAWGHTPVDVTIEATAADLPSTVVWQAAAAPAALPWTAMIIIVAVATVVARRPRRALALAIVLVLALLAFENGVHSVHHLSDRAAGATCVVASATAHVAGTLVDAGTVEPVVLPSAERLVLDGQRHRAIRSFRPDEGRAPPSTPS